MSVEGGRGTRADMLCRRRTAEKEGGGGRMCSPTCNTVLTLNCLTLRAPLPSKNVSFTHSTSIQVTTMGFQSTYKYTQYTKELMLRHLT